MGKVGDFRAVGNLGAVGEVAAQTANWLVMVYVGACNDLQSGFQAFLDRNFSKRLSPNAAVLMQVTLSQPGRAFEVAPPAPPVPPVPPAPPQPPATLAQTLRYAAAPNAGTLSLVHEWNPYPLPANNPRHLYEFIKWGLSLTKYRHAKPVLILSGHSAGLLGVLEDRSQGYPMLMTIPAMSRALRAAQAATQRRIALLVLDMCFMNGMEILYELAGPEKPAAQYLILPHDDAPLAGMPLEGLIAALPSPVGAGQSEPAAQTRQAGLAGQCEPTVQAIVNYVNRQWSCDNAACYGIRLDSARMEAMATTLNAIAARYLETTRSKTYFPRQLPYLEIMQCVRDSLAPQLITTVGWPFPAPSLRISLAEDLRKKRIPGEIYGALRFSRLPEWKRLIGISSGVGSHSHSHSHSHNYATKLFPEMVPVPNEILIENLLERFPGWERSQAKRKLKELGLDRVPNISYSLESRLGAAPYKNIYFLR